MRKWREQRLEIAGTAQVAHLAQARPHGLELDHLDLVDGGMMRQADGLVFFMAEEASLELAGDGHCLCSDFRPHHGAKCSTWAAGPAGQ